MTIEIPEEIGNRLSEGMAGEGGAQLPFLAPVLWIVNGNLRLKSVGGAQYFGGWATNQEDIDSAAESLGKNIPAGLTADEMTSKDGKPFSVYTARAVIVAPIAVRTSWTARDGGMRMHDYFPGARHHGQALVYLASKEGQKYTPWGPAVLSAKGFQVKNLMSAFDVWNKATLGIRRKVAPKVPAWCFYLAIGTFGQEAKQVMVGAASSQSPITPIGPFLPESGVTEELLVRLFVGQEVAAEMADLLEQAQDWLNAWKQDRQGNNGGGMPADYAGEYPDPVEPGTEEDVPF